MTRPNPLKTGAVASAQAGAGHESRFEHRDVDPGRHSVLQSVRVVEDREFGVGIGDSGALECGRQVGGGGLSELDRVAPNLFQHI